MRSKLIAALVAASLVASPALAQSASSTDTEEGTGLSRSAGIGIFGSILALGILFIFLEVVDNGGNDNNGGTPVSP